MHLSRRRALLLATVLTLSNGPALAGSGKVVGGGVARTIESIQNLARNLELDEGFKRLPGGPPNKQPLGFAELFDLSSLGCA